MSALASDSTKLLDRSLRSGRIHSAYLLSGPGENPRHAALAFARGLVCSAASGRPCEQCPECRRSSPGEPIPIDGRGVKGPLYRHVGDHPDLFWIERGDGDTRVRIGQIRALQNALRLRASEGGFRAAVIADAEWLNQEAQNALLRLLEEPPDKTSLILVATGASGLLATIRSRCQRVRFPAARTPDPHAAEAPEEMRALAQRLDEIARAGLPDLLDWAEECRGERATAAARVQLLLETGSMWLRERVHNAVRQGGSDPRPALDAFKTLAECRKDLAQRNANPQMVAERALLAVRGALVR